MNKVDTSQKVQDSAWANAEAEIAAANDATGPGAGAAGAGPSEAFDEAAREKQREATITSLYGTFKFGLQRGPLAAWKITDEECQELAEAYADLVLWLWPDTGVAGLMGWWQKVMDRYGPILAALYVTGKVVAPRVMSPEQFADPQPEGEADETREDEAA